MPTARVRRLLLASESAAVLVAIMFLGSLALWVGVPVAWLWIGSLVQAETGSVDYALAAMMAGTMASVAVLVLVLSRLNRLHVELRAARGHEVQGATALEHVLVFGGMAALLGFAIWFFGFSGSEPFPLQFHY